MAGIGMTMTLPLLVLLQLLQMDEQLFLPQHPADWVFCWTFRPICSMQEYNDAKEGSDIYICLVLCLHGGDSSCFVLPLTLPLSKEPHIARIAPGLVPHSEIAAETR